MLAEKRGGEEGNARSLVRREKDGATSKVP